MKILIFFILLHKLALCTGDSLKPLNTLLSLTQYPTVSFNTYHRGDTVDISVFSRENRKITAPTATTEKIIETLRDHTVGNDPVDFKFVKKITGSGFFYYAFEYKDPSSPRTKALRVVLSKKPLTRFMIFNPSFSIPKAVQEIQPSQISYVRFFQQNICRLPYDDVQAVNSRMIAQAAHLPRSEKCRIPLVMHTIWITNPEDPKSPRPECFAFYEHTMNVCNYGWNQMLWVHKKSDHSELAKSPTRNTRHDKGVSVKEISTLMEREEFSDLKGHYLEAISAKNFGRASDIARVAILFVYGGTYRDTDFRFIQDPKKLHQLCDFYAGFEDPEHTHINNAMVACSPKHKVLEQMIYFITNPVGCPKGASGYILETLFQTGPFALTEAIFRVFSKETDIFLLPHHVFYSRKPVEFGSFTADRLGEHAHHKDWIAKA